MLQFVELHVFHTSINFKDVLQREGVSASCFETGWCGLNLKTENGGKFPAADEGQSVGRTKTDNL